MERLDLLQMYWWDYEKANYVEMAQNAQTLVSPQNAASSTLSGVSVTGFDRYVCVYMIWGGYGQ